METIVDKLTLDLQLASVVGLLVMVGAFACFRTNLIQGFFTGFTPAFLILIGLDLRNYMTYIGIYAVLMMIPATATYIATSIKKSGDPTIWAIITFLTGPFGVFIALVAITRGDISNRSGHSRNSVETHIH